MTQDESDQRTERRCGRCNGSGKEPGTNWEYVCGRCNGSGKEPDGQE